MTDEEKERSRRRLIEAKVKSWTEMKVREWKKLNPCPFAKPNSSRLTDWDTMLWRATMQIRKDARKLHDPDYPEGE